MLHKHTRVGILTSDPYDIFHQTNVAKVVNVKEREHSTAGYTLRNEYSLIFDNFTT